jgi:peptide deformylase
MALLRILTLPDPRLKMKSEAVTQFGPELQTLVENMFESMNFAKGIGLAAAQVGVLKRLIVIDVGDLSADEEYIEGDGESEKRLSERKQTSKLEVYVNPVILSSDGEISYEEGCLSVPGVYAEVKRREHIRVRYQDLNGKFHEEETHGLKSIVIQHEMDHMDGIVFPDRLGPMQRMMVLNRYNKLQKEKAKDEEPA